jgi:hypothetical protein
MSGIIDSLSSSKTKVFEIAIALSFDTYHYLNFYKNKQKHTGDIEWQEEESKKMSRIRMLI